MFHGQSPELSRVVTDASRSAAELGCSRVGSEHLLLALSAIGGPLAELLGAAGATEEALRRAVEAAKPHGAGAAADRAVLAPLGVDLDLLVAGGPVLDRPAGQEPLSRWVSGELADAVPARTPHSVWTCSAHGRRRFGSLWPAANNTSAQSISPRCSSPSTPA